MDTHAHVSMATLAKTAKQVGMLVRVMTRHYVTVNIHIYESYSSQKYFCVYKADNITRVNMRCSALLLR